MVEDGTELGALSSLPLQRKRKLCDNSGYITFVKTKFQFLSTGSSSVPLFLDRLSKTKNACMCLHSPVWLVLSHCQLAKL